VTPTRPTQAVILAGGRGSRLRPITDTVPKGLVPFHGKPFNGYIVDMLREQGFESVLFLLGYLADSYIDHFGDGSEYGIRIEYDVTDAEDLTAYRVQHAQDRIEDSFLLLYCDNYWPMDFDRMWQTRLQHGCSCQVTVYSNDDGYSRDSVIVDGDSRVSVFDRTRTTPGLKGVEISYAILSKDVVLPLLPKDQELFEQAVYPTLASQGQLGAYWTRHRYYSVGSHERLPLTDEFLARQPTVILDRDGVLNRRPPRAEYVRRPDEFHWLPGSLDALRLFREAGWRVVVVSNQAGVARGVMTMSDLEEVNGAMRSEAVEAGGHIEQVYVCPHGWDDGCDCRKPKPGMLFAAQRDFQLDLTRTYFVGDDERDAQAADAASAKSILVDGEFDLLHHAQLLISGEM
jgi:histidinol-phosphate phosphatase family protein